LKSNIKRVTDCIDLFDYLIKALQGNSQNVPAKQIEGIVDKFFDVLDKEKMGN